MASTSRPLARAGSRLTLLLVGTIVLAGCGSAEREQSTGPVPRLTPPTALAVPAALTDEAADLRAGPGAVPLELQLPSLDVKASVVGVGITPKNEMDAPTGPAGDPVCSRPSGIEAAPYQGR